MDHVTADHLAGHALGHPDLLTAGELEHLDVCADCRSELDVLVRTAEFARGGLEHPPMMPGPHVWQRIMAEVVADRSGGTAPDPLTAPAGGTGSSSAPPVTESTSAVRPRRARRTRPRWAAVAVAAALGLIVGVGASVVVDVVDDRAEIVASAPLAPLPGHTGQGTAELVRTSGVSELRVRVESAASAQDYRELWLINTDGKRMYSLGVLPDSGRGSYPIPAQLSGGLAGFTIVDVSIEPYDGDALHSRNSLVRGTLPA